LIREWCRAVRLPSEPNHTRQVASQANSTAVVHIGNSKRVVVDANARSFGNKRHIGTSILRKHIKQKPFADSDEKGLIPSRKEGGDRWTRKVRRFW